MILWKMRCFSCHRKIWAWVSFSIHGQTAKGKYLTRPFISEIRWFPHKEVTKKA